MVATFDFTQQLNSGASGEEDVLNFFTRLGWTVERTGMTNGQRNGIDAKLSKSGRRYRTVKVKNRGYHTHGLIVPINVFEQEALDCEALPNPLVNCRMINL